ncbi:MAG: DUF1080 domain-containing protein [Thermoguttaceae bacterium]|nr:DUF1080 domain-containing protein [Thermoguttaceae bacterium]
MKLAKMKFVALFVLLSAFAATVFAGEGKEISLFNGKTLDGWYKFVRGRGVNNDPNNVFTVQDGAIRISGEEFGCVTTNESFSDYVLTLEFKWGTQTWGKRKNAARDSGVLVHSYGEDGGFGGIWMRSVEANVIEGGLGDFWLVTSKKDNVEATCDVRLLKDGKTRVFATKSEGGKPVTLKSNGDGCFHWKNFDPAPGDVKGIRGANDLDRPNDWNKITVIMKGKNMKIFVNDQLVNEIYDLKLPQYSGKIQLQSEGAEIFYRNIKVRPL